MVPCYAGKNPQLQTKEPLLNDEGLLVATEKRKESPNELIVKMLERLSKHNMKFETVRTGLKIGNDTEKSVCVVYNVSDTDFGVYVLKRHPEALPKVTFKTVGEPIPGSNSKSSRVTIQYEDNTAKEVSDWILQLPGEFESGRVTFFNDAEKVKKPKAEKVKKEKPSKKAKKPADVEASTEAKPEKPVKTNKKVKTPKTETVLETKQEKVETPQETPVEEVKFVIPRRKKVVNE